MTTSFYIIFFVNLFHNCIVSGNISCFYFAMFNMRVVLFYRQLEHLFVYLSFSIVSVKFVMGVKFWQI